LATTKTSPARGHGPRWYYSAEGWPTSRTTCCSSQEEGQPEEDECDNGKPAEEGQPAEGDDDYGTPDEEEEEDHSQGHEEGTSSTNAVEEGSSETSGHEGQKTESQPRL
jgi:hypothetical protein